jgi:hypothetical protein
MKKGENKMSFWERVARHCEEEYGTHIDWEDRFFICPECGEPIYECDWEDEDLRFCPVCDFWW